MTDFSLYPNFTELELRCKITHECDMHPDMMEILQGIRNDLKKPMFISSGFRSVKHPVEQEKDKPGEHTHGMAVDIICHGDNAVQILTYAIARGVKRLGFHQKGNPNGRFIHIGIADRFKLDFPVGMWTY